MLIWFVEDDGSAMFRLQASQFGPQQKIQSVEVIQRVLNDLGDHGIDVTTDASYTRVRESSGTAETVWKGRFPASKVADAREYFQRLALSYRGG